MNNKFAVINMLKFKMCKYILTAALCWKPQVTVLKILATILTPPPKKKSLFMISLITFDDFNFKVVSYIFLQVGAIVWIFFFQFCMKSVSYQI